MDINFFKKVRILDGGMGQELLARGMKPQGTLWSATAILNEKYHKLLYDTHVDYIKAGAEVIVTTSFFFKSKVTGTKECVIVVCVVLSVLFSETDTLNVSI